MLITRDTTRRIGLRSCTGASQIAEFISAFYVIFLLALVPLLDLGKVFVAASILFLATNDLAAKSATQPDFSTALNTMATESTNFQSFGLARFANLVPEGGYVGCGNDLYIISTDTASGAVSSSFADQPLNQNIDTQTSMYELAVRSTYSVSPLLNLSAMPVIGSVPGLGKPVVLSFTANRPVEHPGGLVVANSNSSSSAKVVPFNRTPFDPSAPGTPTSITWRDPSIFEDIVAAGQTVISVNVVNVQDNYNQAPGSPPGGWVNTGLSVQPGQTVWLDTQATGTWNNSWYSGDANGVKPPQYGGFNIALNLTNNMLIGWAGPNPPILPYGHQSGAINSPRFIPSGNTLLNYQVGYAGPIWLAANDNQTGDSGSQMVRVIITQ